MNSSKKVGIFGGSFNPIHLGHLNSIQSLLKKYELDEIRVVPNSQNPLRGNIQGPGPRLRLNMVEQALKSMPKNVVLEDFEVKRGGVSYTVETLEHLQSTTGDAQLYLIIGADQLEKFGQWRNYLDILQMSHLIVTSRPGADLPRAMEDLPEELQDEVVELGADKAVLNTGKNIYFCQLNDVNISATELRKRLREGAPVQGMISAEVLDFIKNNELYESYDKKIGDFEAFTHFCAQTLFSRKSLGVMAFDLREQEAPSEFTLVASGTSTRHAMSLAEFLVAEVKKQYNVFPQNIEGLGEGRWIVLDYGALMVHLFYDFTRQEYRLEDLWQSGKSIPLHDPYVGSAE